MDSKAIPDLAQVRQAHRYSARRGAGGVAAVFRRGECGRPHAEVPREPDGARGDGAHIAQLPVPHGTASRAGTRHAPGGRQGGTRRLSTTSVCTELTWNCWAATSGALHGDDAADIWVGRLHGFGGCSAQVAPIDLRAQNLAPHRTTTRLFDVDAERFAQWLARADGLAQVADRRSNSEAESPLSIDRQGVQVCAEGVHRGTLPNGNFPVNTIWPFTNK